MKTKKGNGLTKPWSVVILNNFSIFILKFASVRVYSRAVDCILFYAVGSNIKPAASNPPSTLSTCPLTQLASGEARNNTPLAISSAVP